MPGRARPQSALRRRFAALRRSADGALVFLVAAAFWFLAHPYHGSGQGTLIYMTRALADLDPDGIGRDIMFRLDGQSGFIVLTTIFRWAVMLLGDAKAGMAIGALTVGAWFCAALALADRLAAPSGDRRLRAAIFVCIALLPSYYGGFRLFGFAESGASPRPFAEAAIVASLVALMDRRRLRAIAFVSIAALIHPIMALPGAAVLVGWFCIEDRRLLIPVGAAGIALLIAAKAGLPLAERLFRPIDADWYELLRTRNPHLFPSLWQEGWIGRATARTAVVLVAASCLPADRRRVLLLAVAAGFVGLLTAEIGGEYARSLLVAEMQTWRMLWLPFALSSACFAVGAVELWRRGPTARLVLGLLALAFVSADRPWLAAFLAAVALALHFNDVGGSDAPRTSIVPPRAAFWLMLAIGGLAAARFVFKEWEIWNVLAGMPGDAALELLNNSSLTFDLTALAVPAVVFAIVRRVRLPRWVPATALLVMAAGLATFWDSRTVLDRELDRDVPRADLQKIVASRPGEILWLDDFRKTWSWLERPNWVAAIQGAGLVFSRDLAMTYGERAKRAIGFGLADDDLLTPLTPPHQREVTVPTPDAVGTFCAASDAPAFIVAPLVGDAEPAPALAATTWRAPTTTYEFLDKDGVLAWEAIDRFAVIPCAGRGP